MSPLDTKPANRVDEFFTEGLSEWDDNLSRRDFLKLSSAALAMAGLSGCIKPPLEKMFSYASQPEDVIPGESQFYATHFILGGHANGILVETHEGRPTKIEGNPSHPANRGAASAIQQAHVLSLYDPRRVSQVTFRNAPSNWLAFQKTWETERAKLKADGGAKLAVVTETSRSPVERELKKEFLKAFPNVLWVEYSPLVTDRAERAAEHTFGKALTPIYDFTEAKTVVTFQSDFLYEPKHPVSYAADFANNKELKLYSVEASGTITGAKAKRRLAVKPSRIPLVAIRLANELLGGKIFSLPQATLEEQKFTDLIKSESVSEPVLFIAGDLEPVEVHQACALLNAKFAGKSIRYIPSESESYSTGVSGLAALVQNLNSGKTESVIFIGGNPVFASPNIPELAPTLTRAKFSVHLATVPNATSNVCQFVIPMSHNLESWSDGVAFDGTLSFGQPLIAPLYAGSKSKIEFLDYLTRNEHRGGRELLLKTHPHFESHLTRGVSNEPTTRVILPVAKAKLDDLKHDYRFLNDEFEVSFYPDRTLYDGRFHGHPWLEEMPDPITRLTWENAALIHPADMKKLTLEDGDEVEIEVQGKKIQIPVLTSPLQANGSVALYFGYGVTHGVNVYPLWNGIEFQTIGKLRKTGKNTTLACVQLHHSMEGRELVRTVADGEAASKMGTPTSLYDADPIPDADEAWAMVIDLDRCTGCGACVVACQSENNIPSVGREGVLRGREMHWIRVDRYFANEGPHTITHFQPVPCMHCEKAPCEPVCPTGATVHGTGGLNQMVYNRCVGTRYCSNNCPYKVRRFNFLTYNDKDSKLAKQVRNPNVSVRTRGVMEKCTYCTQRISEARIKSIREDHKIRDQDLKTACQSTCPSQAIEFGNLVNANSQVSKLRKNHRHYGLLEELGTRPRTTYLAKLRKEDR